MSSLRASTKEVLAAYIDRACDPTLHEPNLSLDLEIADFINQKKANTPREAAVHVVRLVNHRNTHVSMLALHLLDLLVKNCGYPFHLQVATKDFLNELVRRFPERPPVFPPPPMAKILELIHEWKNTICLHSKHKEDLTHIRDMHRLLSYKGYRFPEFDKRAASVLNPTNSLQTPEEMEEEDRAAQAAKLQELIRRGTPKDLAAAQELMKIMSGAEPDKKPNYEEQVQKELDRVRQRALLLNEMLDNAKPKERFAEGDAYSQIAQKCRQVQPKIKKWIEESAESDPEQMGKLLEMNDLLNAILDRYEAFKQGDRSAVAQIQPGASRKQAAQNSLIDFGDEDDEQANQAQTSSSNPIDDLSSLSLGPSTPATAGSKANSLFDLSSLSNNNNNTTSTAPAIPFSSKPPTPASGTYFSNPNLYFNNNAAQNPTTGSSAQQQFQQSSGRNVSGNNNNNGLSWSAPSYERSNSPLSPASGGVPQSGPIQLGGGGGFNGAAASSSSSASNNSAQKKKDPFEDLLS